MIYIGQTIGVLAIIVSALIYIRPNRYRMVFLKLVTYAVRMYVCLRIALFFNTDNNK